MNILEKIQTKAEEIGFHQIGFIKVEKIPFSPEVRKMCQMNSCGMYGTNWQCPPAVGEVDELAKKARAYPHGILMNTVWPLEDSFDLEGMQQGRERHTQLFDALKTDMQQMVGSQNMMAMGAGGCNLCTPCAYKLGKPCFQPEKTTASMEACGINVLELSREFGFAYINGKNTVTYFGLILFSIE